MTSQLVRVPYLLLLCCCALASAARGEAVAPDASYAVVVSKKTHDDPQWKAVVDALVAKHQASVVTYEPDVAEAVEPLRKIFPRYACFVAQPEEANRAFVVAVHRLTRRLDADPYTDVLWGIVTGYNAADALRIAKLKEPLLVRKGAGGTAIPLELLDEGVYYQESTKNIYTEKKRGGTAEQKTGTGDDAKPLAEVFNAWHPDLFVTSGHATERDWQIGYPIGRDANHPNGTDPNHKGQFICKDGVLIAVSRDHKTEFPINSPNPKVYLAAGNCLMGHIRDKQAMALAWMHSGGVNQMIGYVVSQWYPRGGFGTLNYFFAEAGRYTLSEAFYFNNQTLVYDLETRFPKTARTEFQQWNLESDPQLMGKLAAGLGYTKDCPELKDNLGLLWDRDTVAFYGDPAWEARLAPRDLPFSQELTAENGVYTFRIRATADCTPGCQPAMLLPQRLKDIEVTKGQEFSPLVTDNFIMLTSAGKFGKGKTYEVAFKAEPVNPPATPPPPPPPAASEPKAPAADPSKIDPPKEPKEKSPPNADSCLGFRQWTSKNGKFKVRARLHGVGDGQAKLEKEDGKVISVPISKLSEADQRFIDAAS